MKGKDLLDTMENVDAELIREAQTSLDDTNRIDHASRKKSGHTLRNYMFLVAAAVLVLAVSVLTVPPVRNRLKLFITEGSRENTDGQTIKESTENKYALINASYPAAITKPSSADSKYIGAGGIWKQEEFEADNAEFLASWMSRRENAEGLPEKLEAFYQKIIGTTMKTFEGENTICSPVNLYMAAAMLSEVTNGDSRSQLLDLLGEPDIESVRDTAKRLWNSTYQNNNEVLALMANSIWLKEGFSVYDECLKMLAGNYFADVYQGDPTDPEYLKSLKDWLNEKTGGQLRDSTANLEMDPEMLFDMAQTLYYCAKWQYPFDSNHNETLTFHGLHNGTEAEFMTTEYERHYYYYDHFGATPLDFSGGDTMWLILPDEGYTPDQIASETDMITLLLNSRWGSPEYDDISENHCSYVEMTFKVPKFDVTSDFDAADVLKALGISDVFDSTKANFSPILPEQPLGTTLSAVKHSSRVIIDEEGCTATAFTLEELVGAPMPEGHVDFILDRPFLFVITDRTGAILFTGSINDLP